MLNKGELTQNPMSVMGNLHTDNKFKLLFFKLRNSDGCPQVVKLKLLDFPNPGQETSCNLLFLAYIHLPFSAYKVFILFLENVLQLSYNLSNLNAFTHNNSCLECRHQPSHFCLKNSHLNFTDKLRHYLWSKFSPTP